MTAKPKPKNKRGEKTEAQRNARAVAQPLPQGKSRRAKNFAGRKKG